MDKKQFIEEVVSLKGRLINYAFRMLSNTEETEDAVQEAFMKLWDMRYKLYQHSNIPALSFQVTKWICLNTIRRRKRHDEHLDDIMEIRNSTVFPEKELNEKESVEIINQIIERLPDLQKSILKMKHIEGMDIDEIALLTGSNLSAIRMNLSRARKKIQELYFKIQHYDKSI
ncbi:MAG: sigma-70 family RNA polymerase sigma factor [Prevotellaceae bacterium]|jgi:RNA polymerase sigma-70 factor (ECF subfamily)|nr:sigma-70 family RNA polymerase sigma factor [Prevotellaceae bacterium]